MGKFSLHNLSCYLFFGSRTAHNSVNSLGVGSWKKFSRFHYIFGSSGVDLSCELTIFSGSEKTFPPSHTCSSLDLQREPFFLYTIFFRHSSGEQKNTEIIFGEKLALFCSALFPRSTLNFPLKMSSRLSLTMMMMACNVCAMDWM